MEKKVNLFIVGAAKAGTSSIYKILSEHPDVFMSPVKEPNFFSKDVNVKFLKESFRLSRNFSEVKRDTNGKIIRRHQLYIDNINNYNELFEESNSSHLYLGEGSVSYLYSQLAAKEIFQYNPNAKIIICLRNPVSRAYSHFLMDKKVGRVSNDSFLNIAIKEFNSPDKLWGENPLYIDLSLYYPQVKRYYDIFPSENILVLNFNSLENDFINFRLNLLNFLSLNDYSYLNQDSNVRENKAMVPSDNFFGDLYIFLINNKFIIKKVFSKKFINSIKKLFIREGNIKELDQFSYNSLLTYFEEDLNLLKERYDIFIDK